MKTAPKLGIAALAGTAACAGCCAAIPLTLPLLGGGAIATALGAGGFALEAGLGFVVFAITLFALRRSRKNAAVACTLTGPEQRTRGEEFRRAFQHLKTTETLPDGFRWRFHDAPGFEKTLRDLARREQTCCRFAELKVKREDGTLVWEARGDEKAQPVLAVMRELPRETSVERLVQASEVAFSTSA